MIEAEGQVKQVVKTDAGGDCLDAAGFPVIVAGRMVQFVMVAHIGLVVLSLVTEDCSVWLLGLPRLAVSLFMLCCSPSLSQFQQERLGRVRSGHQLFSSRISKVQVPSFVR